MKIPIQVDCIDQLLGGGFEAGAITELYGEAGSGKTNICIQLARAVIQSGKKVIYIDTEGGFSIERMKQLAGKDINEVLEHIILLKPVSLSEQKNALEKLKHMINEKIGLIVVDTLTIFYRLELSKNEDIKTTNNNLIWQLSYLTEIARKKNIPILITNQVYSDFNNKDDVKMVGGNILKYNSKCLIKLKKQPDNKRNAILMTHRSIPEGKEIVFAIINEGIILAKES